MPGAGSVRLVPDVITLTEMKQASLAVLRLRAREIACVIINPFQGFKPPRDQMAIAGRDTKAYPKEKYAEWLRTLKKTCQENGILLIFDEIYIGFRCHPRGAQAYYGVDADIVTYGKSVGGGSPVGVVCGRKDVLERSDPEHPMRVAFLVGTFAGHPTVMGQMNQALKFFLQPEEQIMPLYKKLDQNIARFQTELHRAMEAENLPIRVSYYTSVWSVSYASLSMFHFMYQYYLREQGLILTWVGTGKLTFSLDYEWKDMEDLKDRMLRAARLMKEDGWWWLDAEHPIDGTYVRNKIVKDALGALIARAPREVRRVIAGLRTVRCPRELL